MYIIPHSRLKEFPLPAFSGFDSLYGIEQSPRVAGSPQQVRRFFERIVFFQGHHHHGTGISSGYYHAGPVVADFLHSFGQMPSRMTVSYYSHGMGYCTPPCVVVNSMLLNFPVKSYSFPRQMEALATYLDVSPSALRKIVISLVILAVLFTLRKILLSLITKNLKDPEEHLLLPPRHRVQPRLSPHNTAGKRLDNGLRLHRNLHRTHQRGSRHSPSRDARQHRGLVLHSLEKALRDRRPRTDRRHQGGRDRHKAFPVHPGRGGQLGRRRAEHRQGGAHSQQPGDQGKDRQLPLGLPLHMERGSGSGDFRKRLEKNPEKSSKT